MQLGPAAGISRQPYSHGQFRIAENCQSEGDRRGGQPSNAIAHFVLDFGRKESVCVFTDTEPDR